MVSPKLGTRVYSPSGYTIIVIGAGMAGITATYHLVARGYNVLLLEARASIGGRVNTIYLDNNVPVERGCQFIHGPGGNPLYPLLKRFHIELKPILREKTIIYNTEGKPIDIESHDFQNIIKKKTKALSSRRVSETTEFSHKKKLSFGAFVENIHKSTVYIPYRKDSLLPYKFGYTQEFSGGNYLITNGLNHLVEGLLKESEQTGALEIKLGQNITQVQDNGIKVTVTSMSGEKFEGDAVICTVPLGVLKQNKIKFNPPLPEKKIKALENMNMAIHSSNTNPIDLSFKL